MNRFIKTKNFQLDKLNPNRVRQTWLIGAIKGLCTSSIKFIKAVIAWDLRDILQINSHRIHVARQDDVKVLGCLGCVAQS